MFKYPQLLAKSLISDHDLVVQVLVQQNSKDSWSRALMPKTTITAHKCDMRPQKLTLCSEFQVSRKPMPQYNGTSSLSSAANGHSGLMVE